MKRTIIEDHGYDLISVESRPWVDQAHRPYEPDEAGWVSVDDFRALLWLIAFAVIFVAICAVSQ